MPNQKPRFSVIIPTGNRAHLAKMAVQSVLNQTYQDFEIIIADWARTGASRHLAALDKRITYLHAVSDAPYGSWNIGAKEAAGDYVLWLDDDNYLLPYAFELLNRAITETHADVITSSHLYYYDNDHPRVHVRNSLGVIPFTGQQQSIDLRRALIKIFSFTRSSSLPRFHTSSTILSKRVIKECFKKLGFVLLDFLPNMNSFPIPFSFANTCIFIDHPTVIVGRYGNSISQNWGIMARHRFQKQSFPIMMSPVCGYTRINGSLENYLTIKKLLPDFYRDVPIGYEQFSKIYMQELTYLDTDLRTLAKNWMNLLTFLKTFSPEVRNSLRRKAMKCMALAPAVYLSRRLRLYKPWRLIFGRFAAMKENRKAAAEKINGKKEFYIPLSKKYNVESMYSLAHNIRDILIAETNRDIFNLPKNA